MVWVRWYELPLFSLNTNLTINNYLFFYWLFKFYNQNYVIFMLIIVSTNNIFVTLYLFFYWLFKFYNQNYVIFMLIIVSTNNIFVTLYNFRLPPFFYMPLFYLLPISTNYNFWICRALQTVRVSD